MGGKQHYTTYGENNFQAASTALTGSYVLVGKEMPIDDASSIFLHIHYTAGNETSIEVKAQYMASSGGTESQSTIITTSGATSVITPSEFQYTSSGGSKNLSIPFGIEGTYVKFYIKATGGTPTGTYGASICMNRE